MINEYYPEHANIIDKINETKNTFTYLLEFQEKKSKKDLSWIPGQFMMMGVLGVGEAAISISNIDEENVIYATIRKVGNVTSSIFNLKKGDYLCMRGPYGLGWPLDKIKGKNILIIAGGMGLAPLRGVINYISRRRNDYKFVEIIYGAKTPEDMIFKYDFNNWNKIKDSSFQLTADEIPGNNPFECRTGLVTSCFPAMNVQHKNTIALICGPEIMMRYAAKCLETIGFSDNQIYLSLERRMKCGIGKCGHCQIGLKYVCRDGPIFNYDDIKPFIRPL